jgi:hypothetical protein
MLCASVIKAAAPWTKGRALAEEEHEDANLQPSP